MPTYTVTVAGSERHDGEAPYTYVVDAPTLADAARDVVTYHKVVEAEIVGEGNEDVLLVEIQSGAPPDNVPYVFNILNRDDNGDLVIDYQAEF